VRAEKLRLSAVAELLVLNDDDDDDDKGPEEITDHFGLQSR